ncbi:FAD-dependent oxidoreductase, partial [Candidatus Peregrinibacteria bacterium]|nr:FAD-dependent oxidoreductase [Candidatus Peregrinibacteria bacterium]
MTPPKVVKAKLIKKIPLNDESLHFIFEMHEKAEWAPGQFALIGVNDNQEPPLKRPFSIASSPLDSPQISFMIKHHHGRATNWLFDKIKEGEETELMIPMGHMTLQENEDEQLIIGTGIGIAPMFSLIDYLAAKNFPQKTRLVYGARHVKEIFYLEKLEKLSKEHENFELYTTVS